MGKATFLLFGVLDLGIAGFVWGCLPETAGRSLEEIEGLFEERSGEENGDVLSVKGSDDGLGSEGGNVSTRR
jgi:hypothetical protein